MADPSDAEHQARGARGRLPDAPLPSLRLVEAGPTPAGGTLRATPTHGGTPDRLRGLGDDGGGVSSSAPLTIRRCIIEQNDTTSGFGGGVSVGGGGDFHMVASTARDNTANDPFLPIGGVPALPFRCTLDRSLIERSDRRRMTDHRARYGPHNPDETYVAHALPEQLVDLGEVLLNYATLGDRSSPPLLLVPGQTESWWGYEAVMPRLAEHFEVFAVDPRGQGRTPERRAATRSTTWATTSSASSTRSSAAPPT